MKKNNVIQLDGRGICIIDADIDIFRVASVHVKESTVVEGMEDMKPLGAKSIEDMVEELKLTFEHYMDVTHCDSYVVMLSGDSVNNFRKKLLPSYKANRSKVVKPPMIGPLREALLEHPEMAVRQRDELEGDDLCGIFATAQRGQGRRTVIVTLDKDMKTLPGNHYNPHKHDLGVWKVTPKQAAYYHMFQTLTGDPTDNYKGCRGIGPKKAEKILGAIPPHGTATEYYAKLWPLVLDTFTSRGYTPQEALVQARCARILRSRDWKHKTKRILMWTPPTKGK